MAPAYGQILPSVDPLHEPFIEIRDRETRELITVIELLSPTNKALGSDREQYIGKRKVILASNAHLVEIDALRGGERMPIQGLAACDYAVMVSRSYERPRVELWPLVCDPLPTIPIPLRLGDRDATINLQRSFMNSTTRPATRIMSTAAIVEPPLFDAHAEWAAGLVAV